MRNVMNMQVYSGQFILYSLEFQKVNGALVNKLTCVKLVEKQSISLAL